ncbi:MAG: hypothetical protein NTZ18_01550 [Candidatus Komeilibacteria bacterium]|nr:hypothetical protein [Candidatus Komeilibacteria bacterium]
MSKETLPQLPTNENLVSLNNIFELRRLFAAAKIEAKFNQMPEDAVWEEIIEEMSEPDLLKERKLGLFTQAIEILERKIEWFSYPQNRGAMTPDELEKLKATLEKLKATLEKIKSNNL